MSKRHHFPPLPEGFKFAEPPAAKPCPPPVQPIPNLSHQTTRFEIQRSSTGRASVTTSVSKPGGTQQPLEEVVLEDGNPSWIDEDGSGLGEAPDATRRTYTAGKHKTKRQKSKTNAARLSTFLIRRNAYLAEMHWHDGWGCQDPSAPCPSCNADVSTNPPLYKCSTCFGRRILCCSCMVSSHRCLIDHVITVWRGYWQPVSLADLGVSIQLGHDGGPCTSPDMASNIKVVSTNGVFHVRIQYCLCRPVDKYRQLLRASLFPGSESRPKTAFTLDFLNTFHKLTLQGKLPPYDFLLAILHKTDNLGLKISVDALWRPLSYAIRIYRYLKMLKRAGRGFHASGADNIEPGELVIPCLACPQPGKNLPDDWRTAPPSRRWLYISRISLDACFKLKLKNRGFNDPHLISGTAYFVEEARYQRHLLEYKKEGEPKGDCTSAHRAITDANVKGSDKYLVSGVVAAKCARHAFVIKAANLPRGERYSSVDYVLLEAIRSIFNSDLADLKGFFLDIVYDIACMYSKNLNARINGYRDDIKIDTSAFVFRYFIPKFHIYAHGSNCQTKFSLNWREHVGRTFGEMIETEWSHIKKAAAATREMGPGARLDTLDDQWGGWNHRRTVGMGSFLLKGLVQALEWQRKMSAAYTAVRTNYSDALVNTWDKMLRAWLDDPSSPDPFEEPNTDNAVAFTRAELAKEEEREDPTLRLHKMSASEVIRQGINLQKRQIAAGLKLKARSRSGRSKTSTQDAQDRDSDANLQRDVFNWAVARNVYIPVAATLDAQEAVGGTSRSVSGIPLWLPSQLPEKHRNRHHCLRGCIEKEARLRVAECDRDLDLLRKARRFRAFLLAKYPSDGSDGASVTTKSRGVMRGVENRISRHAEHYRASWTALQALPTRDLSIAHLKELTAADNRGPHFEHDEVQAEKLRAKQRQMGNTYAAGAGQGYNIPSWIWVTSSKTRKSHAATNLSLEEADNKYFETQMRTEYVKVFSRAQRWTEERDKVIEEMRACIQYLRYRADWWAAKEVSHDDHKDRGITSGLNAYAYKQRWNCLKLMQSWLVMWYPVLTNAKLGHPWLAENLIFVDIDPAALSTNTKHAARFNKRIAIGASSPFIPPGFKASTRSTVIDAELSSMPNATREHTDGRCSISSPPPPKRIRIATSDRPLVALTVSPVRSAGDLSPSVYSESPTLSSNAPIPPPSLPPTRASSVAASLASTPAPSPAPSRAPSRTSSYVSSRVRSWVPSKVPSQAPSRASSRALSRVPSPGPSCGASLPADLDKVSTREDTDNGDDDDEDDDDEDDDDDDEWASDALDWDEHDDEDHMELGLDMDED